MVIPILRTQVASAAQITTRSLTLQTGTTGDGGSKPGGLVNNLFNITIPGGSNVGSIQLLYCTTASGTCTMPTGLATNSAGGNPTALGAQSGMGAAFTLNKTVNGSPYLTRAASTMSASSVASFRLDNVTNPTAANTAFFVRISTFASIDTTGSPIDTGTVAASTANQIVLTGTMPESLIFCTGATISAPGGIPNCASATSGAIAFNQLFSPTDTATATSQMAASTNATNGYSITLAGPTLTSGSNTIPGMSAAGVGVRGTSQFGVNLKANTITTSTIAVGAEIAPASNGTDLRGQPAAGYNTADTFKFTSGDSVANSANGGAGPTNAQIYTASYMVNVAGSQTAGTYTSTLTYVCTATF
jgi:hypothetical protein